MQRLVQGIDCNIMWCYCSHTFYCDLCGDGVNNMEDKANLWTVAIWQQGHDTEVSTWRGVHGPLPTTSSFTSWKTQRAFTALVPRQQHLLYTEHVLQGLFKRLLLSIILICTSILKNGRPCGSPLQNSLARGTVGIRLSSPRLALNTAAGTKIQTYENVYLPLLR